MNAPRALVKEATVETRYQNYQWNQAVMALLREGWLTGSFNWSAYSALGGSLNYLQLIANIRELVLEKEELYSLMNLHGFFMGLYEAKITTPLHLPSMPRFSASLPTNLFIDELETYRYNEPVAFIPPYRMVVEQSERNPLTVDGRDLLLWSPGDRIYSVTGGDRRMNVTAGELTILPYIASYDTVLPLGVIAAELDCGEDTNEIRRIGGGIISWVPKRIYGRRRGLPIIIEWREGSVPLSFSWLKQPSNTRLNGSLLTELDTYIRLDLVCRRVESFMWNGIALIGRHLFHIQSSKEQNDFLSEGEKPILDREALLDSSSLVRMADLDYQVVMGQRSRESPKEA